MSNKFHFQKYIFYFVFIEILPIFLMGCSHTSYLWQAGMGQFSLYNHERPIAEVIADPTAPSEVREKLLWIPEIKAFVEKTLGVKATSNYTTYVDVKRPYVVWSLTVAPADELRLKEWSFPIAGSVPYLGFFKEQTAQAWASKEQAQGNDTYIRGVSAYSTLGYLRDPFLSTMLTKKKESLVNLIFHETAHSQVYLKGEGSFNEQVASFIGDYGEKRWIESTFGTQSQEIKKWVLRRANRRRFGEMLRNFVESLTIHFKQWANLTSEQMKNLKKKEYASLREKLNQEPWSGTPEQYKWILDLTPSFTNNAALLAYLTYEDQQEIFDLLNEKCEGNLPSFLRVFRRFTKNFSSLKNHASGASMPSAQSLFSAWLVTQAGRDVCFD